MALYTALYTANGAYSIHTNGPEPQILRNISHSFSSNHENHKNFSSQKLPAMQYFSRPLKGNLRISRCVILKQRSSQWLNEESLFISGLHICPLNAKVHVCDQK